MKPQRVLSAFEPLFVCGLVIAFALVGFPTLSTLISRSVQPLASVSQPPEEPTDVALADDETRSMANR